MANTLDIDKNNRIILRNHPVKKELAFFHQKKVLRGMWKTMNFTFAAFVDYDIEKAREYFNL